MCQAINGKMRANETPEDTDVRRACNRQSMARKQANETPEDTSVRRACNRQSMAKKQANETSEDTNVRRACNRQSIAKKRANETKEYAIECKAKNRCLMVNTRNLFKPIDIIIEEFLAKVKVGPEYVCTSCHRMMYKHSVVTFRCTKYTKANPELLELMSRLAHVTNGKLWICMSCDRSLCRSVLPVQSKANGMELHCR